jgi:hypothetical protein
MADGRAVFTLQYTRVPGLGSPVLQPCTLQAATTRSFGARLVQKKVNLKSVTVSIILNLAVHIWNTKYRRKKLIRQFSCKLRDKSFKSN